MFSRLTNYFVRKLFNKLKQDHTETNSVEHLERLLYLLRPGSFSMKMISFDSKRLTIKSQFQNIDKELKTLVIVINALKNKKNIYKPLCDNEVNTLYLADYMTDSSKNMISVNVAVSSLYTVIKDYVETLKRSKEQDDEITKRNVFFLLPFTQKLCETVESLIDIQLN